MIADQVEQDFRDKVCAQVRLHAEGMRRYRVFTPFQFEDGDHLAIVMNWRDGKWVLTDEGHTYMHLTYELDEDDLHRGTRQRIISNALSVFGVDDSDGELQMTIEDDRFGDALYSFVQALLKITDVTFLSRQRAQSTFIEDFQGFMSETVPEPRRQFGWYNPQLDPNGKYQVSCRVNEVSNPLFVYALQNDDQTRDATIAILQFEKWLLHFQSIAIFENQEDISRRVFARFSDVCDKQFSNLASNKERITHFVQEALGDTVT